MTRIEHAHRDNSVCNAHHVVTPGVKQDVRGDEMLETERAHTFKKLVGILHYISADRLKIVLRADSLEEILTIWCFQVQLACLCEDSLESAPHLKEACWGHCCTRHLTMSRASLSQVIRKVIEFDVFCSDPLDSVCVCVHTCVCADTGVGVEGRGHVLASEGCGKDLVVSTQTSFLEASQGSFSGPVSEVGGRVVAGLTRAAPTSALAPLECLE